MLLLQPEIDKTLEVSRGWQGGVTTGCDKLQWFLHVIIRCPQQPDHQGCLLHRRTAVLKPYFSHHNFKTVYDQIFFSVKEFIVIFTGYSKLLITKNAKCEVWSKGWSKYLFNSPLNGVHFSSRFDITHTKTLFIWKVHENNNTINCKGIQLVGYWIKSDPKPYPLKRDTPTSFCCTFMIL